MSDPMGTARDTDYPKFPTLVARFGPEYVEPADDDVQAAGDDLRDLIESSLIVSDLPSPGWAPDPKDVC